VLPNVKERLLDAVVDIGGAADIRPQKPAQSVLIFAIQDAYPRRATPFG
jgi:hypothetical protein